MPRGKRMDLESSEDYLQRIEDNSLGLEPVDSYMKRVKANIKLTKAKAAITVAYTLVGAIALALPLHVLVVVLFPLEAAEAVSNVFARWYDIVTPLLGTAIGALFGMSIASRQG